MHCFASNTGCFVAPTSLDSLEAFTDYTVSEISLTNSCNDLAVRTKFDQYYSTVLQYRTAQPLNWFLRYDQSINLLVKSFVSEISDP